MIEELEEGITVSETIENKASVFHTKIFSRITEISRQEWERVYPKTLENYSFFKTLDESGLNQFEFYYIAIYSGENIAGVAPCFLMRYPLDTTVQGPLKTFVLALKKLFPHFLEIKVLVCGLPMGQGRIGWADDPAKILIAVCDTLESFAASKGVSLLAFKDFSEQDCQWLSALEAQGYYKFESMPSTEMDVPYRSLEEYLKTLSHSSRKGLKRKFKKADEEAGLEMEIKDRLAETEFDEVYGLYLQTVKKHTEMSFEIMSKAFFKILPDNMPGETRYFLWRLGGRVVAFALCLVSRSRMIDYYLGFDYSLAYNYSLYFVRFRDLLNWCIQHGIPKYDMGSTGYEPKRHFGFEFVRLFAYAKHRNKIINPFFHLLCKLLKPENFDAVFKSIRNEQTGPHA